MWEGVTWLIQQSKPDKRSKEEIQEIKSNRRRMSSQRRSKFECKQVGSQEMGKVIASRLVALNPEQGSVLQSKAIVKDVVMILKGIVTSWARSACSSKTD